MKEPEESREARRQREKEAERRREALLREIEELILTNYLQALALPAVRRAIEQRRQNFFFANDYAAGRQIDRLLGTMARRLNGLMLNGIRWEWAQSAADLQRRVEGTLTDKEHDSRMRDLIRYQARQSSRQHSADAFVQEKQRDGLNLSGRVWNLAGNAKREIEVILQNAIIEGKRGTEIAHSLREYLQEPGRLFRRVRNPETGQLELSQAARAYHPGRGVYRSAYKNALRLARTELKAAQCEAAWQSARWNPLIVGWEIRLSNNHTTLRDGKPCPFHDMCDELQGTYPKAFRFRGWHPHCRCEMLPIIAGREDRRELYRRIFKGDARERASWSPRAVEEVPQAFTDWVEKNRERARGWRTVPRFIRDNPAYVVGEYGRPKPRPVPAGALEIFPAHIADNRREYEAYGEEIERVFFDHETGGYVVAHHSRLAHGYISKNEREKLEKEMRMAETFARNGYRIEMLEEKPGVPSPDVLINGIKGDFKSTGSPNNIVKHAKKAFKKQGAEVVLFELERNTKEMHAELMRLKKKGLKAFYYFKEEKRVHEP